jgi:hypothetical protein
LISTQRAGGFPSKNNEAPVVEIKSLDSKLTEPQFSHIRVAAKDNILPSMHQRTTARVGLGMSNQRTEPDERSELEQRKTGMDSKFLIYGLNKHIKKSTVRMS